MSADPFKHNPGSPQAIAEGCTCPPQDGPGAAIAPDGRPGYVCDQECPLHGVEVVERALEAGEARLLPDDDGDEKPGPTIH
jgi:hypothetical protein